jgi:TonB family protein
VGKLTILAAIAVGGISHPAFGQVVQGWTIADVEDGCGMMMDYAGEGSTDLYFIEDVDGHSTMIVRNYGWSAKDGETYPLTFWLDRTSFQGEVTGLKAVDGKAGFGIKGNASFRAAFAAASALTITRGETVVDDLSLKGSSAALAAVSRCLTRVKRKLAAEAREKARFAHITKDPFASSTAEAGKPMPAEPRTASAWITNDDYPPGALRAEEQGTVAFDATIGADGRVTSCTVTSSSGSTSLDEATCRLITRRARFTPAKDAAGNPISSTYSSRFRWELTRN